MKRSEKVKESQYLWEFEKNGMLQYDKERYGPLIEILDPLFKSGIVTYDEWVDHVAEVFKKHALQYPNFNRKDIIDTVWKEIEEYYKQFNIK